MKNESSPTLFLALNTAHHFEKISMFEMLLNFQKSGGKIRVSELVKHLGTKSSSHSWQTNSIQTTIASTRGNLFRNFAFLSGI